MGSSRTYNSVKNATINLVAKLAALLCGFIIRTFFLKCLGDQYTGISSLFTDILNLLSFTELGIGTAVSFSLYKPIAENDHSRISQLMKLYKYVYTAISGIVLILGLLFIPFLKYFVKNIPDIKENIILVYIMYVLKTSFSYLLIYKSTFIIAKQKQYIVTGTECVITTIKTLLDIIILITTKNFMAYLWLELICVLATNLIISAYSNKEMKKSDDEIKISKSDFISLFKDVKDIVFYKVCGVVLNSTDSMIISRFVNITSVTLLSNYNIIFNAINGVIYQILSAMTASVGNLAVTKSKNDQKKVFSTINFLSFIFSLVECTGLWLCVNSFITMLWGKRYALSMPIVALLCINAFFINMHLSADMFRTANGIFHKGRLRPLATATVNLVVSLIAVRSMGLFGVLLGTVVSRAATQLWYDPKLVFNTAFNSSVKKYYLRYLMYSVTTAANCFAGMMLINALSQNPTTTFALGAIYTGISSLLIILLFYSKTFEYKSTVAYAKAFINR